MSSPGESQTPVPGAAAPPPKHKEKKRVGFSQGPSTPHHDSSRSGYPSRSGDTEQDRSSHDGVDHTELTRVLSLILQEEGEGRRGPPPLSPQYPPSPHLPPQSSSRPGSRSGSRSGSRPSSRPGSRPHSPVSPAFPGESPLRFPTVVVEPEPSYFPPFPPARQQQQEKSEKAAKERADRLAQSVERDYSNPQSVDGDGESEGHTDVEASEPRFRLGRRRAGSRRLDNDDDERDDEDQLSPQEHPRTTAAQLVEAHAKGTLGRPSPLAGELANNGGFHYNASLAASSGNQSGYGTPNAAFDQDPVDYVPPPAKYHNGILSSLLRLYNNSSASGPNSAANSEQSTPVGTPASSRPPSPLPDGAETPKRRSGLWSTSKKTGKPNDEIAGPKGKAQSWGVFHPGHRATSSTTSLSAGLLGSSSILASTGSADIGHVVTERVKRERPGLKRNAHSASSLFQKVSGAAPKSPKLPGSGGGGGRRKRREEEQMRITVHIAHVLSRHQYLTILCRALMMYGAPTHRLEDYLKMSARVLEIEAQFLYIPGCMIVSFDDSTTHTAEVKLVRAPQGVDLGKLSEVHQIYKEVVHDLIGVDEATTRLNAVMKRKNKYKRMFRVLVYGLASVAVAPFAFGGRFIDLPVAFILGCLVGLMGLVAAPRNAMYSNVFEISAAVVTSFLARAFGSIHGGELFCFSALAQSSIALILPGYMVLCASLELQSQNIVAGSVRMVYAMIYTLFLGYGITIGTAVYGALDKNATSETNCKNSLGRPWYFLFVPMFTICLCIINQAKWRQMPIMVSISVAGFCVNTYASSYFSRNAQIPNTLGALCIGVLANLYARTSRTCELLFYRFYREHVQKRLPRSFPSFGLRRLRRLRRQRRSGGHRWLGISSGSSSRRGSDALDKDSAEYLSMGAFRHGGGGGGGGGGGTGTAAGMGGGDVGDVGVGGSAADDPASRAEEGINPTTREEEAAAKAKAEQKAPGSTEMIGYGLAAAAMLPAIFVQVPSGLAVNGSLLSGLNAADQLTHNASSSSSSSSSSSGSTNDVSFTVLFSVIEVAIGITVGLSLSALIVYPLGKRRSGLFSF